MDMNSFLDGAIVKLAAPVVPSERVFYLYLISAFVIAIGTYIWFSYREESQRPEGISKGLLGYIFDPRIWFHASAKQDYVFFFLNGIIYYGIIAQLLVSGHVLYGSFVTGLEALFGTRDLAIFSPSPLTAALYTLAVVLAIDLAIWLTHYLQHKVGLLWQFHQVHHSAEVLTPMTVYRMHPVDLFFSGLVTIVLTTLAFSGFAYLTASEPAEISIMNVNVALFTFYLIGYNLRHSHIWVSYPLWLSYIFISPAQHQTHHSIDVKHYDRNFGLIFAFWDWLFGTLYVPKGYEKLEFGISRDEPNPFGSVTDIYIKPFRMAWAHMSGDRSTLPRRVILVAMIGLVTFGFVTLRHSSKVSAANQALPSLHLEDLTWTEIDHALGSGYDTVIVPTAGTEQNGPHVILGKHRYIVHETSDRIAARLGDTLVAPVISYVPEGDTGDAPTGHMMFPGTISLPEDVFEVVLEHTARSLATHGFTRIVFIGDSGGNQSAQAAVAHALNAEWADSGVKVLHIEAYYSDNDQVASLLADGYSMDEIGLHAGIRDTSELLAVHPQGVRGNPILPQPGADPGYSGAPAKATAKIGERMITLKVEAALEEIERLTGLDG